MAYARDPFEVVHDSPIFLRKLFLPQNLIGFFEFKEKLVH